MQLLIVHKPLLMWVVGRDKGGGAGRAHTSFSLSSLCSLSDIFNGGHNMAHFQALTDTFKRCCYNGPFINGHLQMLWKRKYK